MRAARALAGLVLLAVPAVGIPAKRPADRPGVLAAFDGSSGRRLFRIQTKAPAQLSLVYASTRAVVTQENKCFSADRAYVSGDTSLVAFDPKTGHELWRRPDIVIATTEDQAMLPPGVLPVRTATGWGPWTGLDPRTGRTVWSREAEPEPIPAATNKVLLTTGAGVDGARLNALDRASGKTVWSYEVGGNRRFQMISAGDDFVVLVVSDPPVATIDQVPQVGVSVHVLSTANGQLQRTIPLPLSTSEKFALNSLRLVDSTIVVDIGGLVAFDAQTGAELWRTPGPSEVSGLETGHLILAMQGDGRTGPASLTALDPHTGRARWEVQLGRFNFGATATSATIVVFRRNGYDAVAISDGRRRWHLDASEGVGVAATTSPNFYVAGGCPTTSVD